MMDLVNKNGVRLGVGLTMTPISMTQVHRLAARALGNDNWGMA